MWPTDKTMWLIQCYEQLPELWDNKSSYFRDKNMKKQALIKLSEKFQIDVLEIERKIKGLKTQFAREYMKIQTATISKSMWFGYQPLQFLLKNKKIAEENSTITEFDVTVQLDDESSELSNDEGYERSLKRKQEVGSGSMICKKMKYNDDYDDDANEYSVFGEYVAMKVQKIKNPRTRVNVQQFINTILFQAELTNYDTTLSINSPNNFSIYSQNS